MEIVEVNESHADIVGRVHADAWKDTYTSIFPTEYLDQVTSANRTRECLAALKTGSCKYYLVKIRNIPAGIVKIASKPVKVCEIESLYFLKEYRGNGYGAKVIEFIKKEYRDFTIILWVLEQNESAIGFYQKVGFELTGNKRRITRGREYYQVQFAYT